LKDLKIIIQGGRTAFNGFLDILYPRVCAACNNMLRLDEGQICFYCYHKLPVTGFQHYSPNPMDKVFRGRFPVEKATAFFYFSKGGRVQHLIHNVKYHKQWEAGYYVGELFGKALLSSNFLDDIDAIFPIPLNPKKLKQRGYNQSTCFGSGLSSITNIPINDQTLIRKWNAESQTLRGRFSRWENVNTIFGLNSPEQFEHCHILLFDDVVTTGATLEAAAQTLASIKAVKISVATVGFASQLP